VTDTQGAIKALNVSGAPVVNVTGLGTVGNTCTSSANCTGIPGEFCAAPFPGSPTSVCQYTVNLSVIPNPGDPGGQPCTTAADCPFVAFGQTCGVTTPGVCDCACTTGCTTPDTVCAAIVTDDLALPLTPIVGASFTANASGDVCFDVNGTIPGNTSAAAAIGATNTGSRILAFGSLPVALDCGPGTVQPDEVQFPNPPGTIIPNTPADQICFPIN
jgi:hypothetical protein